MELKWKLGIATAWGVGGGGGDGTLPKVTFKYRFYHFTEYGILPKIHSKFHCISAMINHLSFLSFALFDDTVNLQH